MSYRTTQKQEHGQKGHINVFELDHETIRTNYGKHNTLMALKPRDSEYDIEIDEKQHHNLETTCVADHYRYLKKKGYLPKGKGLGMIDKKEEWTTPDGKPVVTFYYNFIDV